MNEIKFLNTKESTKVEQNWMSKKELMDICKCSDKTLEQIISSLSIETGFDTQNHIINDLNCTIGRAIQNHIKKGVLWKQ